MKARKPGHIQIMIGRSYYRVATRITKQEAAIGGKLQLIPLRSQVQIMSVLKWPGTD